MSGPLFKVYSLQFPGVLWYIQASRRRQVCVLCSPIFYSLFHQSHTAPWEIRSLNISSKVPTQLYIKVLHTVHISKQADKIRTRWMVPRGLHNLDASLKTNHLVTYIAYISWLGRLTASNYQTNCTCTRVCLQQGHKNLMAEVRRVLVDFAEDLEQPESSAAKSSRFA